MNRLIEFLGEDYDTELTAIFPPARTAPEACEIRPAAEGSGGTFVYCVQLTGGGRGVQRGEGEGVRGGEGRGSGEGRGGGPERGGEGVRRGEGRGSGEERG